MWFVTGGVFRRQSRKWTHAHKAMYAHTSLCFFTSPSLYILGYTWVYTDVSDSNLAPQSSFTDLCLILLFYDGEWGAEQLGLDFSFTSAECCGSLVRKESFDLTVADTFWGKVVGPQCCWAGLPSSEGIVPLQVESAFPLTGYAWVLLPRLVSHNVKSCHLSHHL